MLLSYSIRLPWEKCGVYSLCSRSRPSPGLRGYAKSVFHFPAQREMAKDSTLRECIPRIKVPGHVCSVHIRSHVSIV